MASDELINSWKKTTEHLLDARSHLSEAAEGICLDEIKEFQEYLDHNELELALDALEDIFYKCEQFESLKVMELLVLAAANMGLQEHVEKYNAYLSKKRGW